MDVDLFSLEAFLAVCDEGSFAGAARRLFLSEPAISVRIKNLEERLGVVLFSRSSRGVRLTHAGVVLQSGLSRIMDDLRACIDESQAAAREAHQQVTLWAPPVTLAKLLPPILERFGAAHPDIYLRTRSERPSDVATELILGRLDCAAITDIHQPHLDGFEILPVLADVVGLVVASDHPLAAPGDVTVGDLEPFRLVAYERRHGYWPLVRRALTRSGYHATSTLAVESLDVLRELTRRGQGIAFLPNVVVLDDLQRGEVVFRPLDLGRGQRLDLVTWFCFSRAHALMRELAELGDIFAQSAARLIEAQLCRGQPTSGELRLNGHTRS
jgi:DNA-binding transcriptional LysR family regulator